MLSSVLGEFAASAAPTSSSETLISLAATLDKQPLQSSEKTNLPLLSAKTPLTSDSVDAKIVDAVTARMLAEPGKSWHLLNTLIYGVW